MPARTRGRVPALRAVEFTAAYVPQARGWYSAEILEARGVTTQGKGIEEARKNLRHALRLMLEEAPHQFGRRRRPIPPGALTERILVVLPA